MEEKRLSSFFEDYIDKKPLFKDKKALQSSYFPKNILHREKEISNLANYLAPSLRLERPSNLFVYGKTGTGKTLCVKHVLIEASEIAKKKNIPLHHIYLNCKLKRLADTEYRLIAQLIREYGGEIAATGLPTEEVYKAFFNLVDSKKQLLILILDEIDNLIQKTGDGLLYNLTRINEELKNSQISIIGISNNLNFMDSLDPRVKSSLSEEELLFPPYNALQLQKILKDRAELAFHAEYISEGTLEKCAAYSARDHGDARKALELLRVAGEIAERNNEAKITTIHIDAAEDKIEKDRVVDISQSQPKQFQAVFLSILNITGQTQKQIFTGETYINYKSICDKANLRPLTQRRVSDIIAELDMLGLINMNVISKGRYGRTREIYSNITQDILEKTKKALEEGLGL